jgi:aminoglycoside 2''-phosphotransferase
MSSDPTEAWPNNDTSLRSLVDRVIAAGAIGSIDRARLVTDGMQHVVVVLDDHLVARFARTPAAAESLQREAELLAHLDRHVSAALPVPIHVEATFTIHVMLHGAITTRSALAILSERSRRRLVEDVTTLLCELATAVLTQRDASPASTSMQRLVGLRDRADRLVRPLLWEHQRQWLDDLFEAIERTSFDHTPVLIHGDLAPYHLLHDPLSGALSGVLDFGVAGVGDPATDLACLIATWGETYVGDFARARPELDSLMDRARLVAMALPLEWATVALEHDSSDMAVAHLGHVALDIGPVGRERR